MIRRGVLPVRLVREAARADPPVAQAGGPQRNDVWLQTMTVLACRHATQPPRRMRLHLLTLTVLFAALPAAAQYEAHLVADIYAGSTGSAPESPIVYAERLYFVAGDLQSGRELRSYDAATGQVSLVADINAGPGSSLDGIDGAELFTIYDGRLFFGADNGEGRDRLWDYNAATGQASLVDDVLLDWGYEDFIVQNDVLFFGAWDSQQGQELWSYSISTGQALLLYDINPDGHAEPRHFTAYDDRLFIRANDGEHGSELWAFDPTSGDADLVADVNSGSGGSYPAHLVEYDGSLFFVADDGIHGRELWALSSTPVANEPLATPHSVHLHAPHPNPARRNATVTFEIADTRDVSVEVLDVLGRRVALLTDGPVAAGEHMLRWEADGLPGGVYFIRLTSSDTVQTQRLTLVR